MPTKRVKRSREDDDEKKPPPSQQQQQLSSERSCAEALMMACDERLGAQSPAALMVCDTFLARDLWTYFVHQSYLPPAASQMWACGRNDVGQLGLGDTQDRPTPTEVTALHGRCIHAVACGDVFTMAVVDDGELWATGYNEHGQLGLGDWQSRSTFTRVSGLSGRKVVAFACGRSHTLALLESGELFAWGWNRFGQLGLGDDINRTTPEPVAALSGRRVVAIACGDWHSVAVLETGELFAWGYNNFGQLGLGDNAKRNVPTQVTALAGRRVVAVACGGYHTAAVLESGELFTWGLNEQGQLGHGDLIFSKNTPQLVEALRGRHVIAVACGNIHTLALIKPGEVFAWGDCFSPTPQHARFVDRMLVKSIHCIGIQPDSMARDLSTNPKRIVFAAVLENGKLLMWSGNLLEEQPVEVLADKRVHSVALGNNFHLSLVF